MPKICWFFAGRAGFPISRRQQQHNTTPTTTGWGSGCHFRRVCRGGSCHVFSLHLLRNSFRNSFCRRRRSAWDVIFGRQCGVRLGYGFFLGFQCPLSTHKFRISVSTHKFHYIHVWFQCRQAVGLGCHFWPAVGVRLGYVKESKFV